MVGSGYLKFVFVLLLILRVLVFRFTQLWIITHDTIFIYPAGGAQGTTRSAPAANTRTGATGGLGGLGSLDLSSLLGGLGGNARTGAAGGLGGLGSADLSSLLGGPPDASHLSQMLQNPAMMQMMQNIMSDPQSMNQVQYFSKLFYDFADDLFFHSVMFACPQLLNMNPNARNLMESNTQLRDMFQNPEFLRQMTSPEALQVKSVAIQVHSCSHSLR
jgi:ubiquilin